MVPARLMIICHVLRIPSTEIDTAVIPSSHASVSRITTYMVIYEVKNETASNLQDKARRPLIIHLKNEIPLPRCNLIIVRPARQTFRLLGGGRSCRKRRVLRSRWEAWETG